MTKSKILLVEDEGPKRSHIHNYLNELGHCLDIVNAMSVTSALDQLEEEVPDLLLLDMSLPTFDVGERESGGRPQGFGGIEVLRYMSVSGKTCPTVVITGYEAFLREEGTVDLSQLKSELSSDFPSFFRGVLHYNSTYAEWKTELARLLKELEFNFGE